MLAYMFPGQGSQCRGMGQVLFDTVQEFACVEDRIDDLLGYSVRELCLHGPESRLRETRYTQPCLFIVNALHYYDAIRRHGRPQALVGHSLGEYDALLAAGAFDLLTGIRLVKERGALMATATGGAMAAVLELRLDDVQRVLEEEGLTALDVANYNTPLQTVVAGPADVIRRAAASFQRRGAVYVPLPVSAAFHSRYMVDASARFSRVLESYEFSPLRVPVVSNVTGEFYPPGVVKCLLARQLSRPVRWVHGIQYLRRQGVSTFVEVGPGSVLTRLGRQIDEQPQEVPGRFQASATA